MNKAFYYKVEPSEVDEYKKLLTLMKIPFEIEQPVALLKEGAGSYTIVFPNMSVRLYSMVRKLFKRDGIEYSKMAK